MAKREKTEGFTPISQVLPDVEDLEKALQPSTPQARHHFTRERQVNQLALAGEADSPDMGFMARLLTLCTLPRTNPGNRREYKRLNGPYRLYMQAGPESKLPYGNLPRLLLAWVCTEAVRTRERDLILGSSLSGFMRELGIYSDSGGERGDRTRLRNQMDRLFHAHVSLVYEDQYRKVTASSQITSRTELWWDFKHPEQQTLWNSRIRLGEDFFNEIIQNPVPLDMNILKALKRSSLGLDLYMWLSYKSFALYSRGKPPERLSWARLYRQFGADPSKADDPQTVKNFRKDFVRELAKLRAAWPTLDFATPRGCFEIRPCPPSVPSKALKR